MVWWQPSRCTTPAPRRAASAHATVVFPDPAPPARAGSRAARPAVVIAVFTAVSGVFTVPEALVVRLHGALSRKSPCSCSAPSPPATPLRPWLGWRDIGVADRLQQADLVEAQRSTMLRCFDRRALLPRKPPNSQGVGDGGDSTGQKSTEHHRDDIVGVSTGVLRRYRPRPGVHADDVEVVDDGESHNTPRKKAAANSATPTSVRNMPNSTLTTASTRGRPRTLRSSRT